LRDNYERVLKEIQGKTETMDLPEGLPANELTIHAVKLWEMEYDHRLTRHTKINHDFNRRIKKISESIVLQDEVE